jgi:5'-3' exonuclease
MRLLLVDGTNVAVRYAFAILGEQQVNPEPGDTLKVMRSVERALRDCAEETKCGHAIVALDSGGETWRKALFPEYKATRKASTSSWSAALSAYLSGAGWLCLEAAGFEADDIIATLAVRASERGHRPAVLSSDSDLLQLAGEFAAVYQFGGKGEPRYVERSPVWVTERYGLRDAAQLALYKALVGESSDNLPGVSGVGPKKAAHLLSLFRSREEIETAGVFAKTKREQLALMLTLTTLRYDVPLGTFAPSMCAIPAAGSSAP